MQTSAVPDIYGRFGPYGGSFVPETLMHALRQLSEHYEQAREDPHFQKQFHDYLKACLARMGDDSVGEEDAETVVNSLATRLADLVVGEIKVQFLAGRLDRVQALLQVAKECGIEQRQLVLALRPLRALFRTEIAELDALLAARLSAVTVLFMLRLDLLPLKAIVVAVMDLSVLG